MSIKTIKVPAELYREGSAAINKDAGTVRLSFSSDVPYLRHDYWDDEDYYEVLSHDPADVDLTRMKAGTPLLFNHDRDIQIGRNTSVEIKDGKGYVESMISKAPDVESYRIKMEEEILVDTSVGYQITDDGECIGAKDGIAIYKFKWAPFECSMVTIPADQSVGLGRTREKESTPHEIKIREKKSVDGKPNTPQKATTPKAMLNKPGQKFHEEADDNKGGMTVEVVAERERQAVETHKKADKQRRADIRAFAANFNKKANLKTPLEALEAKAIDEDMSCEDFRHLVLENWTDATRVDAADADPNIGMSDNDLRDFSFAKFFLEAHNGKLTGLEKECSDTAAAKYRRDKREFSGHCVPQDVRTADFAKVHGLGQNGIRALYDRITQLESSLGRSQNATSFTAGGFLVGTTLLAGSYIDILRNVTLIGNGPFGIIELSGVVGNIAIPKQTSTLTTYWLAEGATVSESNFAGGQLVFSPKRLVARNSFTKQLLAQGTPSVEMLVRTDMALAEGVELDRVAIQGNGLAEPLGVINTSGIDASVTFSGNWTQAKSLAFEYALENANVRTGEMSFLTSPLTKSYAKGTPQVASSTFPIYIWMPEPNGADINGAKLGIVNGYQAAATKNTTANVLFGVWPNNFTRVRWAGMDIVVNPYTGDASELIYVTQTQWIDQGIRYPQAFSYSVDAPTSP